MNTYDLAEIKIAFKAAGHTDWTIEAEGPEHHSAWQYLVLNRNKTPIIVFGNSNGTWRAYFCARNDYINPKDTYTILKNYPSAGDAISGLLSHASRPADLDIR